MSRVSHQWKNEGCQQTLLIPQLCFHPPQIYQTCSSQIDEVLRVHKGIRVRTTEELI